MFELNRKNILIAAGAAIAVTAAITGAVVWATSRKWCPKKADLAYESMMDAYNNAVKEYPSDRNKAAFAFELAAAEIRKTFIEENTKFDTELKEWLQRFDDQIEHFKKEIRKA